MGNVNPLGPRKAPITEERKVEKEVKGLSSSAETTAGSVGASQAQLEVTIREFLVQKFGETKGNEIADRAIKELKGKNLSYDVVRNVILDAAKNSKETVSEKYLDSLMIRLFPPKEGDKLPIREREYDPEDAAKFQMKEALKSVKQTLASEEAMHEFELKRNEAKEKITEENEIKRRKPLDPEKRV